ncbi:MAG: LysR family transcriptional regulator [Lachnospiraceae bacterium]|nr:LysR family transcriptional regulator [Lachnospiraceae bacterium]
MNEKHMQYVLTVLKEGSFTAAARKLYVSQPSLSQIIKAAESNLGAPIFDRSADPLTLTPAGALYVDAAKQITAISTNLTKQVEELGKEEFGTIRLGISVQRGMELLPYLYPSFQARYPHVELKLIELGSAAMERSVLEGIVDIALLTTSPRHEALIYDLIQEETLVLLVNRRCALAARIADKTPIDISEAKDEAFVCSRHGHSVRAILDALLAARDLKPKIALETVSIEIGKRVTATSPVVMPCPDSYTDTGFFGEAPYSMYPLLGVETPRHFYACYRRDLYLTKYMKDFLKLVHEIKDRRKFFSPDAERKQI